MGFQIKISYTGSTLMIMKQLHTRRRVILVDEFALQLLGVELLFEDVGPDVALGEVLVELGKGTNLNQMTDRTDRTCNETEPEINPLSDYESLTVDRRVIRIKFLV